MMRFLIVTSCLVIGCMFPACARQNKNKPEQTGTEQTLQGKDTTAMENEKMSKDEWKKKLSDMEYYVTCEGGTERAFTGKYYDFHEEGMYLCVRCGNELFSSDKKYDSGSGWPSYYAPADTAAVSEKSDYTLGMIRTEITCSKCGAHLGHVFNDGPKPTGLRYCVNSAALNFKSREKKEEKGKQP